MKVKEDITKKIESTPIKNKKLKQQAGGLPDRRSHRFSSVHKNLPSHCLKFTRTES